MVFRPFPAFGPRSRRAGSLPFSPASIGSAGSPVIPLPSLPLAAGAKVMAFGHSFIANGHFTGSTDAVNITSIQSTMRSDLGWMRALDQRYNMDAWADPAAPAAASGGLATSVNGAFQGIGGDQYVAFDATRPGLQPRQPYVIARRPDIVCLIAGINDFLPTLGNLNTAADLIARVEPVLDKFLNAGIWVVADTIAPVSSTVIADGSPKLAELDVYNAWLINQASVRQGLKVYDVSAVYGAASGRPNADTMQTDGLHPQDRAVYATAMGRLAILQTMVSAGSYYDLDPTVSNLMPNAGMLGTGGSKTNVTGNLASNYSVNRGAGTSTIVASKEVINGSFEKQVFTITPVVDGTAAHTLQFQQLSNVLLSSLGISAGDYIQQMMHIELSAWDGWIGANTAMFLSTGSTGKFTQTIFRPGATTGAYILPTSALSFWAISDPVKVDAALSIDTLRLSGGNAMLIVRWLAAATGNGVVKCSRPILRKVPDPRTAWNL